MASHIQHQSAIHGLSRGKTLRCRQCVLGFQVSLRHTWMTLLLFRLCPDIFCKEYRKLNIIKKVTSWPSNIQSEWPMGI